MLQLALHLQFGHIWLRLVAHLQQRVNMADRKNYSFFDGVSQLSVPDHMVSHVDAVLREGGWRDRGYKLNTHQV